MQNTFMLHLLSFWQPLEKLSRIRCGEGINFCPCQELNPGHSDSRKSFSSDILAEWDNNSIKAEMYIIIKIHHSKRMEFWVAMKPKSFHMQ